ncbi:cyclic nucleotide-binding domain-containing protein, partial [Myxococcota bacterium]|nr:cyclic nucleotide-binding domain-containing protein [Myxococcota bacterium]
MLKPAEILDNCKFFSKVQGPSRERLLEMSTLRRFSKGQLIFQEGDACAGMYVVGSGLVRIFKISRSGHKEHTLHLAHPGLTFAEVATIGAFPCPAYAEALEETLCLLLPQAPFSQMLASDPMLAKQLLMSLSIWVKQLVDLMESVALKDA